MMKLATYSLLFLGAIPLLIYPFIVLANVMSLAGHRSGNEPAGLILAASSFFIGSLAYPAVYVPCVVFAIRRIKKNRNKVALCYGISPLGYLVFLLWLFELWANFD